MGLEEKKSKIYDIFLNCGFDEKEAEYQKNFLFSNEMQNDNDNTIVIFIKKFLKIHDVLKLNLEKKEELQKIESILSNYNDYYVGILKDFYEIYDVFLKCKLNYNEAAYQTLLLMKYDSWHARRMRLANGFFSEILTHDLFKKYGFTLDWNNGGGEKKIFIPYKNNINNINDVMYNADFICHELKIIVDTKCSEEKSLYRNGDGINFPPNKCPYTLQLDQIVKYHKQQYESGYEAWIDYIIIDNFIDFNVKYHFFINVYSAITDLKFEKENIIKLCSYQPPNKPQDESFLIVNPAKCISDIGFFTNIRKFNLI